MRNIQVQKIIALVILVMILGAFNFKHRNVYSKQDIKSNDFDATVFQTAPREYGPLTRWWWPGNDVTSDELQREIKMFADNGFAGVEVQPLTMGLNPNAPKDQADRIYSWDTPSFYEHLRAVMSQAQQSKVIVDMNGGSGWPLGGAFFKPEESMKTLAISDTVLSGGQEFNGALPAPGNHTPKPPNGMLDQNYIDNNWAEIKSVIAARITVRQGAQTILDPATITDLLPQVHNRTLNWRAPQEGNWNIVIAWDIPSGEKPSLIASYKTNYVIDHLDPEVVNRTYDYLLGDRTGLPVYFGAPLRAIFNDSYEFHTDRIISPDFLNVFRTKNGYDIAPYLSSVYQQGYDHPTYLSSMFPGAKPPFIFNEKENWRLMHDYDKVVNEVFKNNFIRTSNNWMHQHKLLHRTQAYGFPLDLIGSAGAADIPEAEQLFAEGSEGYLKLVTSGAHLYNHPLITQESFVSIYRAEMTTPQKIKMWADKSLACGVNQLIYHGTPYKYNNGEYGKEGWNTWSSPYMPYINFSTGMNESDHFWKDIKSVNKYLSRCQYALRSGSPETDVLIYMPFIDFTEDQMAMNPEEILYNGYFKGVEPALQEASPAHAPATPINTWYKQLWKIINQLEANGVTWEFVNDESLQKGIYENGGINIKGNHYKTLVLANLPYIDLATARNINSLSRKGLSIWAIGALPQKQPSYLNYEANDRITKQLIDEVTQQENYLQVNYDLPLDNIKRMQPISFADSTGFSRQINRVMSDGTQLKFIWNKTDQWKKIDLNLNEKFASCYWLNPENGQITKNTGKRISFQLPPYGSVIFYAAKNELPSGLLSAAERDKTKAKELVKINSWQLKVGGTETIDLKELTDWRNIEKLKFNSEDGTYTGSFEIKNIVRGKHYLLEMGKVFYTASVRINSIDAGRRIFEPYSLDITDYIKRGQNLIEIMVTTTRRNGFTGEAFHKNPLYAQFKGQEKNLVPSGLVGPVIVTEY